MMWSIHEYHIWEIYLGAIIVLELHLIRLKLIPYCCGLIECDLNAVNMEYIFPHKYLWNMDTQIPKILIHINLPLFPVHMLKTNLL